MVGRNLSEWLIYKEQNYYGTLFQYWNGSHITADPTNGLSG